MIEYKKGDIFKGTEDVIVHGCNCFHSFGAGVANQMAGLYHEAFIADRSYKPKGDKSKLGEISTWQGHSRHNDNMYITIINAYTQYNYTRTEVDVDYDALRKCMERVKFAVGDMSIAMPKIGAGLAGGDWHKIEGILLDVFKDRTITVYEL